MRCTWLIVFAVASYVLSAQDTVYARKIINDLTSEKFYGRGYLHNGLGKAANYIEHELKSNGIAPLFDGKYLQPFFQTVNTFPTIDVTLNGKKLIPGWDYIPHPSSGPLKGRYPLYPKDSVTYSSPRGELVVQLRKKLTYSVGNETRNKTIIELDKTRFQELPVKAEVEIKTKLLNKFKANNVGGMIKGTGSDSIIIFSAHYDHLGGLGDHTYFPGANDNASGVSMVLNMMKYYKAHPPKYTTVFIFFAGEEAGLLGSLHLSENPPFPLKQVKFMINLDLLGTGDEGIMVVNGALLEKEFNRLHAINDTQRLVYGVNKRGKAANSDHYWFSEKGVPAFFIYTLGGVTAYHDVRDISATLPLTDYTDVCRLILQFVDGF